MTGFGGMVSFFIKGDMENSKQFFKASKVRFCFVLRINALLYEPEKTTCRHDTNCCSLSHSRLTRRLALSLENLEHGLWTRLKPRLWTEHNSFIYYNSWQLTNIINSNNNI